MQFADDIALYVSGRDEGENTTKMECAIQKITESLAELGLDLEPHKTVFIVFYKDDRKREPTKIKLRAVEVTESKTAKFLGITLDQKLKIQGQVQEVKEKMIKANSLLKYMNRRGRGYGN